MKEHSIDITIWKASLLIVGLLLIGLIGTTVYANYKFPHGPIIDQGDISCPENGGSCHEMAVEDTRNLGIPAWAKWERTSGNTFAILGLFVVLIVLGTKETKGTHAKK